ncbi:MAG TPA: alpha/beta hydrolase [Candidatus Tectomicrobia bacterium]|nr:alpha/beta hydrolase [Candidatus Tectomicrobia bacterium]
MRVPTNGLTLAARAWPETGAPAGGRTIVAIHGLTANHTCWRPMAHALADAHRLIAYDLRGRGDSDKPARGYSLAHHDADLAGLLDHFGLARAVLMGHSLGAHIAVRFAAHHPERVDRLVLFDGGLDVRAEVLDSLAPALARLGVEFPSADAFLERMRGLPMFAGRWNEYLEAYFRYDLEPTPGGVRSKVPRAVIEEEVANLQRTRLWVWHHRIAAPTLLLRAPDGLLREDDCLMTQEEADAMAHAIPRCRLVVAHGTNHYTVLLGGDPLVAREVRAFLAA